MGQAFMEISLPVLEKRIFQEMTLTFHTFISSINCLHTNFQVTGFNNFWKIHCFQFFLQKSLKYQIWPCPKISLGQPNVIIWRNYDGLEFQMLHTKFWGNPSIGSGEEDFWRVFTTYGRSSHLSHVISIMFMNLHFLVLESLHTKFG